MSGEINKRKKNLFSALIHGFQGYVAGYAKDKPLSQQLLILIIAALIMVVGYAGAIACRPAESIAQAPCSQHILRGKSPNLTIS